MSWAALSAVVELLPARRWNGPQLRLLLVLAGHHNSTTGRCDPSLATLVEETGLERRHVARARSELEAAGDIGRLGDRAGGRGRRRGYRLTFLETVPSRHPLQLERVPRMVGKGCRLGTRTWK